MTTAELFATIDSDNRDASSGSAIVSGVPGAYRVHCTACGWQHRWESTLIATAANVAQEHECER